MTVNSSASMKTCERSLDFHIVCFLLTYTIRIMEQETGALFRELIAPESSAVDSALYDRKLADTGLFPEEILGDSKVDASQYLTAWIERHDLDHRTSHNTHSTKKTPLDRLLNGTLKIQVSGG